ncbi:hypothetical protein [Candidatus Methylobacter oryzae]|uniref:hypothetical protein n=1 Tax=Candidatus Methylobacter oryzae TaxID=2497749 RepID=UPI0012B507C1|nr:hypothetical protein [Candidatus Methylobacter oryzae]
MKITAKQEAYQPVLGWAKAGGGIAAASDKPFTAFVRAGYSAGFAASLYPKKQLH